MSMCTRVSMRSILFLFHWKICSSNTLSAELSTPLFNTCARQFALIYLIDVKTEELAIHNGTAVCEVIVVC